jgi:O-antigen ligase
MDWKVPLGWVVAWSVACALLLLAPAMPWIGPAVYVYLAYGSPRYSNTLQALLESNTLDFVVVLSFAALLTQRRVMGAVAASLREPLSVLMLALALWIGASAIATSSTGADSVSYVHHSPILFAHALAMYVVARLALDSHAAAWRFAMATCLALAVRAALQGAEGVFLESDVSFLSAMVIPLAVMITLVAPNLVFRLGGGTLGAALLLTLVATRNRAAAIGAAASALVGLWQWRRRHAVVALGVLIVAGGALLAPQEYKDRFRALWDHRTTHRTAGLDRATADERLVLWRAGWAMAKKAPLFGVGPGNFPRVVGKYSAASTGLPAHNNFLHMLAETGFPGLALYTMLFAYALFALERTRRLARATEQRIMASLLSLSLVAYLVAGLFITRHDLVLAYIVLGWSAALVGRESMRCEARASAPAARRN